MSEIRDEPDRQRYVLTVGGATAYAAYRREGERIVFTHTVVPAAVQGEGIGTRLVEGVVADARSRGLEIVAECPFVAAYLDRETAAAQGR